MKTYNRIMEIFWMVVAVALFAFAIKEAQRNGFYNSIDHFLIPLVPLTLSLTRMYLRKKQEKRDHKEPLNKN